MSDEISETELSLQEAKELLDDARWRKISEMLRRMATSQVNGLLDRPDKDENVADVAWRRGFAKALMIAASLPEAIIANEMAAMQFGNEQEDEE